MMLMMTLLVMVIIISNKYSYREFPVTTTALTLAFFLLNGVNNATRLSCLMQPRFFLGVLTARHA